MPPPKRVNETHKKCADPFCDICGSIGGRKKIEKAYARAALGIDSDDDDTFDLQTHETYVADKHKGLFEVEDPFTESLRCENHKKFKFKKGEFRSQDVPRYSPGECRCTQPGLFPPHVPSPVVPSSPQSDGVLPFLTPMQARLQQRKMGVRKPGSTTPLTGIDTSSTNNINTTPVTTTTSTSNLSLLVKTSVVCAEKQTTSTSNDWVTGVSDIKRVALGDFQRTPLKSFDTCERLQTSLIFNVQNTPQARPVGTFDSSLKTPEVTASGAKKSVKWSEAVSDSDGGGEEEVEVEEVVVKEEVVVPKVVVSRRRRNKKHNASKR